MMPSSMEMHERVHRQEDDKAEQTKKEAKIVVVDRSSGRGKRKAAEKYNQLVFFLIPNTL